MRRTEFALVAARRRTSDCDARKSTHQYPRSFPSIEVGEYRPTYPCRGEKTFSDQFSLDQALGTWLIGPDLDNLEASGFQQRPPMSLCAFAA